MGKNTVFNSGFNKPTSPKNGNKRHFILKNHVSAAVTVASILVAGGALGAGHFAYKIGHEHGQVEETTTDRIKTDPSVSNFVDPITPKFLPTGDAQCLVKIKKEEDFSLQSNKNNDEKLIGKVITGVNVSIGSNLLIENDDYTVELHRTQDNKCKSATVTIKSGTMKKYPTGSIYVAPVLQEESFTIKFYIPKDPLDISKGWDIATEQQVYNKRFATEPAVAISGYSLVGWYKDPSYSSGFSFTDPITSDLQLYSKWIEGIKYLKVTFNMNDGSAEPSTTEVTVKKGDKLTKPLDPSRPGYLFDGWYEDQTFKYMWDFNSRVVDKEYTLYAKWDNNFLTYEYDSSKDSSSVKVTDCKYCPQIVEIKSEDAGHNVTKIMDEGFKNCSSSKDETYQINSVTIPSSINTIGKNAFSNCSTLKSVKFEDATSNWTISDGNEVIVQNWIPSKNFSENAKYLNETYVNYVFTKNSNTLDITSTHNIDINKNEGYDISAKDLKTQEVLTDVTYSIDNEDVAKIEDNKIKPLSKGSAKISAYKKGYSIGTFDIEVGSFDNIDFTNPSAICVKRDEKGKPLDLPNLKIPSRVYDETTSEFIKVTGIAENGFKGCKNFNEVVIPSYINRIGDSAFADTNCSQVTFEKTSELTMLNEGLFARSALANIVIPSSIITINPGAFLNCSSLVEVTFENISENPCKLNLIDDQAFKGCSSLEKIVIPKSVTYIGTDAFADCGITNISVEEGNKKYTSRDTTSSKETNCVVEISTKQLVYMAKGVSEIPDTVNGIQSKAFYGNKSLTTMSIPSSVKEIGSSAFEESSLTAITIADGVETIGDSAFKNCTEITTLTIPKSVRTIGTSAFEGCEKLEKITFVDSTEESSSLTIGNKAFSGCKKLGGAENKIILAKQTTSIGESAFANCDIYDVTLNDNLTSLGSNAFSKNNISKIKIPMNLIDLGESVYSGNEITEITVDANNGKYTSPENSNVLILKSSSELVMGCKTSNIPNDVLIIGAYAFDNCKGLTTLTIPDSVMFINDCAFRSCEDLTEVTIGTGVRTIKDGAFTLCSKLQTVIVNSTTVATMDNPGNLFSILYDEEFKIKKTIYLPTGTTPGAYISTKKEQSAETLYYDKSGTSSKPNYDEYVEKQQS